MSLLADLLSKIRQPQTEKQIPPNLQNIVSAASKKSSSRRRLVILAALFAVSVIAGLLLVYLTGPISTIPGQRHNQVKKAHRDIEQTEDKPGQAPLNASQKRDSSSANTHSRDRNNPVPPGKTSALLAGDAANKSRRNSQAENAGVSKARKYSKHAAKKVITPNKRKKSREANDINKSQEHVRSSDSLLYRAGALERAGDYPRALAAYREALEIDSTNYAVYSRIAYIYIRLNRPDEALRHAEMALSIKKDYAPALVNLGIAHAKLGNYNAAETYLSQAVEISSDNESALFNLALLMEKAGRLQKASVYYKQLMQYGNVQGTLGLARIYERQDHPDMSVQLYRKVYNDMTISSDIRAKVRQRLLYIQNKLSEKPRERP